MGQNPYGGHIIRLLKEDDLASVAEIHCLIFPTSRSTGLGKRYVYRMFQWFYEYQPSLSYVSTSGETINGYVIGAIGGYGRKVFRYAFVEIIIGLLIHPHLWFRSETYTLWSSYIQAINLFKMAQQNRKEKPSEIHTPIRAALSGIGVLPSFRGQGIGKLLLDHFERAAHDQRVQLLGLSVEMDNFAARKLYETNGWHVDSIQSNRNSIHYSKKL